MSDVLKQILKSSGVTPEDFAAQKAAHERGEGSSAFSPKSGVQESAELTRILALPERDWAKTITKDLIEGVSEIFRNPKWFEDPDVQKKLAKKEHVALPMLRPVQVQALADLNDFGGLFGPMRVSAGKTLMTLLAPNVPPVARRALLLVPAKLIEKTRRDMARYRKHWLVSVTIRIVSYELLGRQQSGEVRDPKTNELIKKGLLEEYAPDLIIADECHRLANSQASCTRRVKRYVEAFPETRMVLLSGTITKRSLHDYAHLAAWALKRTNPVPRDFHTRMEWSMVLDEKTRKDNEFGGKLAPGALIKLCKDPEELALYQTEPVRACRKAYRKRLVNTPGVVATQEGAMADCSLLIDHEIISMPEPAASEAVRHMRQSWLRPDGEPMMDALELWRHLREVATGFFYRWTETPPPEWRMARRMWSKSVRDVLKHNRRGLDSESQVQKAVGEPNTHYPQHVEALRAWKLIQPAFVPETEAVWLSKAVLERAAKWMEEEKGIVWVEHVEFGRALMQMTKASFYQRGGVDQHGKAIEDQDPAFPMICSIASNAEGRNLQAWSKNYITSPPTSGAIWEQCLDAQTEILTNVGWIGIDDTWSEDLRVAAYEISDGSIHWSAWKRVERRLGEEAMYGISNPHLDIRVTAGHRMVVQARRRFGNGGCDGFAYRERKFVEAQAMPRQGRLPIAGSQETVGVSLTHDELVFLGLFMSDGNLNRNQICLFQSERYPDVIALIENVLASCNLRHTRSVIRTPSNFGPRKYPLHKWNVPRGQPTINNTKHMGQRGWAALEPYVGKILPDTLEDMTTWQLRSLLFGMWAGDGQKTSGTYEQHGTYTSRTFAIATSRKPTADRLQSLCVRRGLRCNVSKIAEKLWMMHISEEEPVWTFLRKGVEGDARPTWGELDSDPSERVWCAEVDSGAIVTRRNGKVAVVGNCLGRTHRDGQQSDEVTYTLAVTLREQVEAFERSCNDARYISDVTGQEQKLCYADIDVIDSALAPILPNGTR